MKRSITIIIPALNEASSVASVCARLLAHRPPEWEVELLVIDDGSSDPTAAEARLAGARVVSHSRPLGLAQVFRTGVCSALAGGAPLIGVFDADGQYRAEDLWRLATRVKPDVDLAVGSRLLQRPASMRLGRYLVNTMGSRLLDWGVRGYPDTQSGLRVFSADLAREVRITGGFTYTQEQIVRARKAGASVRYDDVEFLPRRYGSSRLVKSTPDYIGRVAPGILRALLSDGLRRPPRPRAWGSDPVSESL